MTREEAIAVIRKNYPHVGFSGTEFETALRELIPELAESEDEMMRKAIIDALLSHSNSINLLSERGYQIEDVKAWLEKQKEQKSTVKVNGEPIPTENYSVDIPLAEWSEEDEIELNDAIKYVQNYGETSSDEYTRLRTKEIVEWLKSIRPPFKDKEMKLKILKYLSTRCSSLEFEEVEEYLNNLHPSWKPSEEQEGPEYYQHFDPDC